MDCPKCSSSMEPVQYATHQVQRCTKCGGIWFDEFDKEALKKLKGSEAIDTGDPKVGQNYNQMEWVNCPVDHVPMLRLVDPSQPHIWFESCHVCHGAFFDAGEFKDYKQETIRDFFKDLRPKERK